MFREGRPTPRGCSDHPHPCRDASVRSAEVAKHGGLRERGAVRKSKGRHLMGEDTCRLSMRSRARSMPGSIGQ